MKKNPDSQPETDGLSLEEEYHAARKKAMDLLLYSDRTEQQLREKLKEHGFSSEAVDDATEYVRSYHYIDDRRYAESFLRNKKDQKSMSEIRMTLSERGVSRDILDDLLKEAEGSEKDTIKRLFLKKYGQKDLSDPSLYQKAFRYFSGKGFRYEDIRKAIEEALDELEQDE